MNIPTQKYFYLQNGVIFLCVFIFLIMLFAAWDLYRKRRILQFSRRFNGYTFYPIVGNGLQFFGRNIFNNGRKLAKTFDFPISIWLGHSYVYGTVDVAEIKVILNSQDTFNKHFIYDNLKSHFGDALLLAKFDKWKRNRKLLSKIFRQSILASFVETFYETSCTFLEKLNEIQYNGLFELFEELTIQNFCATLMGLSLDEVNHVTSEVPACLRSAQKFLETRLITSYFYPDFIAFHTPGGKKFLKATERFRKLNAEVVENKRKAFKDKEVGDDRKETLIDILLEGENRKVFDENDIFQEIALFLGAATDTSAGTLVFTFTLLGMNQQVQEKVYREVISTVGINGPISYDNLSKLKYTENAIKESMRLLPVVPLLGRTTTDDVDLGDKIIPTGSGIMISVFDLHRSEIYWPDPLVYNPDRFLPEEVAKRDPYCFIPFSAGMSNCLGMKYAMLMMKVVTANVIRKYHVTSGYKSVEELELTSAVTMRTAHEIDCTFTPRI